jgi:hypothetical protein
VNHPSLITDNEGFDINKARKSGLMGAGSYFAIRSSYSAKSYFHFDKEKRMKCILLCRVLVGDSSE